MEIIKSFLNLADNTVQDYHIKVSEKCVEGVTAVYFDGFSEKPINMEFGAAIEFNPGDIESWMADYRHAEFWCKPLFGNLLSDVHDNTQGFVYKKTDGGYGVVLPVVSEQYKCVLCGTDENNLQAKLYSWCEKLNSCKALAFLYAEGENPYELLHNCAKVGLNISAGVAGMLSR